MGYSPRGHKELDTTKRLYFHYSMVATRLGRSKNKQDTLLILKELRLVEER